MPITIRVGRTEQPGVTPIKVTDRFFIIGPVMLAPSHKFSLVFGKDAGVICLFALPAEIKPEVVIAGCSFGQDFYVIFTRPLFTASSTHTAKRAARGIAHTHIMAVYVPGIHQIAVSPVNPR